MSASLNQFTGVGNLTKEPELKFIPSGSAVCNFSIAMTRKWKDKASGDWREGVTFLNIIVWGKSAEACKEYLHKGSLVLVQGYIQSRSWEATDGQKKYATECVAEKVQFLPSGNRSTTAVVEDSGGEEASPPTAPATETDEDIPF